MKFVSFGCLSALIAPLVALGACASQPMPQPNQPEAMSRVAVQPIRDLNVIRDQAPPVLVRAVSDPYDRAGTKTCPQVAHEVAELDAALGPDLKPGDKPGDGLTVGGLAGDLVEGAVGLPFRGVIRHVTGASQRERELKAAVLAGMVRRGFLKGRLMEMACEPAVATVGAQP